MSRYSNQTPLLHQLRKVMEAVASDPVRPAETAVVRRVHKLDERSVIKILREADVTIRLPRMSEAEVREATRLYASGLSLVDVGKRLDRDHSTIYKALKRAGVRMRDTHGREI